MTIPKRMGAESLVRVFGMDPWVRSMAAFLLITKTSKGVKKSLGGLLLPLPSGNIFPSHLQKDGVTFSGD
jgi:hypothetical protein